MSLPSKSVETSLEEPPDDEPQPTLPLGFMIGGKYVIRRVLGAGGNGAVYEGEHTAVGHRVAIKVVHQRLAAREETMERFQREARICGSLRHPNIGQVYDVGTLEDGSPFMVMELQEGRSLADVIDEAQMPLAAVVDIVVQLLAGLAAAHHSGAVHRDVKPDNVMIVRDHHGQVLVKLVDFGISKRITPNDAERSHVTDEGIVIGSPDYMSPEQLRGDRVDVRTDIYSTGVLLYEAITNHLPFDDEHLVDLLASIMRDSAKPPSALRTDCPPELERVVLKAMAKNAADRYASADEMARALNAVGAERRTWATQSFAALSTPSDRAPRKTMRRRRTAHRQTIEDGGVAGAAAVAATGGAQRSEDPSATWRPGAAVPMRTLALGAGVLALIAAAALIASPEDREQVVATPAASTTPAAHAPAPPLPAQALPPSAPSTMPSAEAPSVAAPAQDAVRSSAQPPQAAASPQGSAASPALKKAAPASAARSDTAPKRPVEDVPALSKQAATSLALGQTAQAVALYQRIVRAAPREAAAWRGLGVAANRAGNRAEAARAFARYLTLSPNAADATRVRAELEKLR